ncbi:MAG: response regulator transcription factor [Clostridium sp.]
MKRKILIIEDDIALSKGMVLALRNEEYEFSQAYTLESAREQMKEADFDLIILDVNLPDGSGFEFLGEVREKSSIPIIMVTANDMEIDVVTGLEMGADDYITKPFSLMVLRARVNTQLRKSAPKSNLLKIDDFDFNFDTMEYKKSGQIIELSKTEQKLLRLLIDNKGNTLSRSDLVDKIWTDGAEYVDENALSVTIKRLRDKLEETPSKPKYIKTVYGIGYSWAVK